MSIRIGDPESGHEVTRSLGHSTGANCLAYFPDDRRIASVGGDKLLKVWDTRSGQELLSLSGHSAYVGAIAISRDGNTIFTADYDGQLKAWDGTPLIPPTAEAGTPSQNPDAE